MLPAGALALGVGAATARADTQPEVRYHGYAAADWAQPYARFMAARTRPAPDPVLAAYSGPPTPADHIPEFGSITRDLAPAGYSPIETGYGKTTSGASWVAVHTLMPGVTAAMWDWWFGWHSVEAARYKLWHPDAHMFAELDEDRTNAPIPDRQKYIGNVSYVDEYIGPKLQQLAIAFEDPVAHGFTVPPGHTIVFGRVGSSVAPADLGWLAHQVRPTPGGCEMRSRFYLDIYGLHTPNPRAAADAIERGASVDPADLVLGLDVARNLLMHCGQEMHHLAGFLPAIHQAFAR